MKAATTRYATCEKDFVLKAMRKGIRVDGRQAFDYRNIDIKFGLDFGCCEVQLGDTKVLAQTSAEIVKPRETRPTEGELFLNIDLSPLASAAYEAGRMSDYGMEINRLVERCLKESRPIDVESLCIVAGERVWNIRVDVLLLNDSGNILDCCCIAAIASLSHFQRPDITIDGDDITIHSLTEKEPVPLNVHHAPICTTFGFVDNGDQIIVDPDEKEANVVSGKLIMAFNIHGEVCCAQMSGGVSLEYEQIMQCAKIASIKAIEINDLIKEGLEVDKIRRAPVKLPRREGLKVPEVPRFITNSHADATEAHTNLEASEAVKTALDETMKTKDLSIVESLGRGVAAIGKGGSNTWDMEDSDEDDCGYTPTPMTKTKTTYEEVEEYEPAMDNDSDSDSGYQPASMNNDSYKPTPMKMPGEVININDNDDDEEGEGYTPMKMNTDVEEYDPSEMVEDEENVTDMSYKPAPIMISSQDETEDALKPPGENSDSEEEDVTVLDVDNLDGNGNPVAVVKDEQQTYKENMDNLNSLRSQGKAGGKKKRNRKKGKKASAEGAT